MTKAKKPELGDFPTTEADVAQGKNEDKVHHDAKHEAPTIEPERHDAEPAATEYLFDPKRSPAYEERRDAAARQAYQMRLRRAEQARADLAEAGAIEAKLVHHAKLHPEDEEAAAKIKHASLAVENARKAVEEAVADVAPKSEPL